MVPCFPFLSRQNHESDLQPENQLERTASGRHATVSRGRGRGASERNARLAVQRTARVLDDRLAATTLILLGLLLVG